MARSVRRRRIRRSILVAFLNFRQMLNQFLLQMRRVETLEGEDPRNFVPFDLEQINDRLCWARFRFSKEQIRFLVVQLEIPERFLTHKGDSCSGLEGLCILLRRLAFPTRYIDLEREFGRNSGAISRINNHMLHEIIWKKWSPIMDFHPALKNPDVLRRFASKISEKGSPLDRCFGFIDGTARPISWVFSTFFMQSNHDKTMPTRFGCGQGRLPENSLHPTLNFRPYQVKNNRVRQQKKSLQNDHKK